MSEFLKSKTPRLCVSASPREQNPFLPNCINFDTCFDIKPIAFLGDSLGCLRDFPDDARSTAGFQLREVQKGNYPAD